MNTPTARQARARARYEALRNVLGLLLVGIVIATLVLILVTGREIRQQGDAQAAANARIESIAVDLVRQTDELATQGDTLEALLARQDADTADRGRRLAAAIGELTAVQQAQLDAHDAEVTRKLQVILDEIGRLSPRPGVVLRLPAAAPRPAPARTTAPRPAPVPRVAPAPGPPPPCDKSGKSGRCKR